MLRGQPGRPPRSLLAVALLLCCLGPLLPRRCDACSAEHAISPSSQGRKGLKLQINVLGDAAIIDRLRSFSLPWIQLLDRSTTEINVFFGRGSENPDHLRELQVDNVVYVEGSTPAFRFISSINHVSVLSSCEIDWFVFVDDDTVLFPTSLQQVLRKYNPAERLYIGNGSEEKIQIALHGWFAQGGGGIVTSKGLMHDYNHLIASSNCLANASAIHGDEKFRDCALANGVPLTVEPGLHQMDMRGDMSGFLEGYAAQMRPLITLHHLGMPDVQLMPDRPNPTAAASLLRAHQNMPNGFLKRFVLRIHAPTTTVVVTLGYSVQVIPRVLTDQELGSTEATMTPWRLQGWDYVEFRGYHFPYRPKEVAKTTYYFQDYYRLLRMQVYGDESRNTVILVCGLCKNDAPICLKPTNTTRSQMVLKVHNSYCDP